MYENGLYQIVYFYSELVHGKSSRGGQRKRYTPCSTRTLRIDWKCDINPDINCLWSHQKWCVNPWIKRNCSCLGETYQETPQKAAVCFQELRLTIKSYRILDRQLIMMVPRRSDGNPTTPPINFSLFSSKVTWYLCYMFLQIVWPRTKERTRKIMTTTCLQKALCSV